MAITGAALQTELGTNAMNAQVVREFGVAGTFQGWWITGNVAGVGRARYVNTTASDNAATQAAAVLTALAA